LVLRLIRIRITPALAADRKALRFGAVGKGKDKRAKYFHWKPTACAPFGSFHAQRPALKLFTLDAEARNRAQRAAFLLQF
jgi:hypothetical protein